MTTKIGNRTITSNFGVIGQIPGGPPGWKTFNVTYATSPRTAAVGACFAEDAASARVYYARVQPESEVLDVQLAGEVSP